jgi:RecB family exonuclease
MKWSYSAWDLYRTCPRKYKAKYIDNIPEPQNFWASVGNRYHKEVEKFFKDLTLPVPSTRSGYVFVQEFLDMREYYDVWPEHQIILNEHWEPCSDKNRWLKCILDIMYFDDDDVLHIIDIKTGQPSSGHYDQLELYAIAACSQLDAPYAEISAMYTKTGKKVDHGTVHNHDMLKNKWNLRIEEMQNDNAHLPRANEWCKNCYVKDTCPLQTERK